MRTTVVQLIHTMAYGGVETALLNWIDGVDRECFEMHLVCFANPGNTEAPFVAAAEQRGIRVEKIPWSRRKPLLRAARTLARILRHHDAQILHTHNWYADMVGAIAARLTPVKTITTLYVWFDYDWRRNAIQWLDRWVIRFYDQITAHCEDTRLKTIAGGISPERVKTLHCGFTSPELSLSPTERTARRRAGGAADGEILLVNIARMHPEKMQASLLRCFARLHELEPRTRLWIAGIGPLAADLERRRDDLGLGSSVQFIGFVPDVAELSALADILVHPAAVEGVPLALCQAMAVGTPIVASAVGGVPEVIQHEHSGLLVPAGDEDGFVAAVLRLIGEPETARRLGANARHFIENEYSLAAAVARLEQTYLELLNRPGGAAGDPSRAKIPLRAARSA